MSEHTPEPWKVFRWADHVDFLPVAHVGHDDKNNDLWIGQDHTQIHGGGPAEDARRIAACVNALKGIPTEYLEAHGLDDVGETVQALDSALRERDEARAMGKELLELVKEGHLWDGVPREECPTCAAIVKAEALYG